MSFDENLYALDIETSGLNRFHDHILGIGVYSLSTRKFFAKLEDFKNWLVHKPKAQFILHRGSFDINFLLQYGCDLRDRFAYDTRSIASILIPAPSLAEGEKHINSLQNLGRSLLGLFPWKLDREDMTSYSMAEVSEYCLKDCKVTYELFFHLRNKLQGKSWEFVENWLMPATRLCADVEWNGVHIDKEGLTLYQTEVTKQRDKVLEELRGRSKTALINYHEIQVHNVRIAYKEMYAKAKEKAKDKEKCRIRYQKLEDDAISKLEPFNWNSSEQLKWLLRDYYQLDIFNKREDKETTNEAMLKTLKHPVAEKLCEYRELEKLCSTCIPQILDNIQIDGKVHPTFDVAGTRTGRLSSSKPNFQNLPKGKLRSFIISEDL